MPTETTTPRPDDPVSPTTGACCSFCGKARGEGLVLVEASNKTAYLCGDCALKSTYLVFAHKQTFVYKLLAGIMPLGTFLALGGALLYHFLDGEDVVTETHIALALIVFGFMACQNLHFWWPDDDLLPRRPWF